MASVHPLAAPTGSPPRRAFMERSISPTGSNYVVVWEWETKPHRWRPYSPEVTQLLERAHYKKINKIYLKDTDPLLSDFYIDVINFEQVCEPTGDTYPVRREYYAHTSPAAKGKKIDSLDFHFKIVSFYRKYHPFFPAKNAYTL